MFANDSWWDEHEHDELDELFNNFVNLNKSDKKKHDKTWSCYAVKSWNQRLKQQVTKEKSSLKIKAQAANMSATVQNKKTHGGKWKQGDTDQGNHKGGKTRQREEAQQNMREKPWK